MSRKFRKGHGRRRHELVKPREAAARETWAGTVRHEADRLSAFQRVLNRIHLFAGGVIPPSDQLKLRKLGFFAVYPPGTSLQTIVADLTSRLKK